MITAEQFEISIAALNGPAAIANALAKYGRWEEFEQVLNSMNDAELNAFTNNEKSTPPQAINTI